MGEISQSGIKSRQKSCWDWPSRLKNFRDKWGKVQKSWIDPDFSQLFTKFFSNFSRFLGQKIGLSLGKS